MAGNFAHEAAGSRAGARRWWALVRPTLLFLVAWSFLNILINLRYPAKEARFWYLLPSLDVTLLLCCVALLAMAGRRMPALVGSVVLVALLLARVLRIGDGIERYYFHRWFNAYLDLRLVPEGLRLLHATLPAAKLAQWTVLVVLCSVAVIVATRWSLRTAQSYLAVPQQRRLFAGVVAAFVLGTPLSPTPRGDERYTGLFAASILPRFGQEVDFLLHIYGYREQRLAEIHAVQRELRAGPPNLEKLGGAPVLLFLVEAYGETVFEPGPGSTEMTAALTAFQSELEQAGYGLASRLLESPVYGGSSWLAQATIATGVQTKEEFQYALLQAARPRTMAMFFRDAGYRTVLAQPGTTRRWPEANFLGFDAHYCSWDFAYRGPRFGWARMPDQYVIDFLHRREIERATKPLFIKYALVSSHAPWNDQPPVVDDWSRLGDGALYHGLPHRLFSTSLAGSAQIREAYLSSIRYDLEVLKRYLRDFVRSDALVFVLGDHQPIPAVTGHAPARGVPVHVLSKNEAFVRAFVELGYSPGLRPKSGASLPLARFLPQLLQAFSARPSGVQ